MSSQNHYKDRSSETCVHFYKTVPEVMMTALSYKLANWRKNVEATSQDCSFIAEVCWRMYEKHEKKGGAKQEPVMCLVGR
jgi:hypothetical protein